MSNSYSLIAEQSPRPAPLKVRVSCKKSQMRVLRTELLKVNFLGRIESRFEDIPVLDIDIASDLFNWCGLSTLAAPHVQGQWLN